MHTVHAWCARDVHGTCMCLRESSENVITCERGAIKWTQEGQMSTYGARHAAWSSAELTDRHSIVIRWLARRGWSIILRPIVPRSPLSQTSCRRVKHVQRDLASMCKFIIDGETSLGLEFRSGRTPAKARISQSKSSATSRRIVLALHTTVSFSRPRAPDCCVTARRRFI